VSSCLYVGEVLHARRTAPLYRFRYRLFDLALDVDKRAADLSQLRWLSHNRFNLFSFHDRDHGPRDGTDLGTWMRGVLGGVGIDLDGGTITLFSMPRVLGYGFNPLSVWYCQHADGGLRAALCEVRNTFGEYHGYLIHADGQPLPDTVRSTKQKCFHVSPFFPVAGSYRFRLQRPGERTMSVIHYSRDGVSQMVALQQGERRALSDALLLRLAWQQPLQSFKVMAAIHWQALKIWLRGGQFHRQPAPPEQEIT
jgi:uncharacterized protein